MAGADGIACRIISRSSSNSHEYANVITESGSGCDSLMGPLAHGSSWPDFVQGLSTILAWSSRSWGLAGEWT